ncbi:MAG: SulP family inorganic anion transporter [Sphingobacteriaceae bacterium]
MNKTIFAHLKSDLPAGIVVFLVAVPLCLGIALASGAPFFSGMISGIVGGILVGALSNSQLSVSGPAAGLAAVVLASINQLGAFETFLLAVVVAGLFQLLLGFLKAGAIANYFPSSVIKGLLTAIGIIIILKQIPHAFGYDKDAEGDLTFLQIDGQNSFSEILVAISKIDLGATLIALVCLAILILFERPFVKKHLKLLPGGLVAVLVALGLNQVFILTGSSFAVSGDHLVNVPVAKNLSDFLGFFTLPDFSQIANPQVYLVALTLAAVASIETLLCIEAVDKLDPKKRVTSTNRELVAQGIGNMTSGLLGGLPITSVIVRSSANLNANAQSKLATIIHGLLLLICVSLIPVLLNKIPLAALASILLITGYKLCNPAVFKQMFGFGKYQWVPFLITVVFIVFTDLLTGVGIGLLVSILALLYGNYKNSYYFHKENHHEGDVILVHLSEEVSFLNKASIKLTLEHLPENSRVVIDAQDTHYIDHDVLELIRDFTTIQAQQKNIDCKTVGFKKRYGITNTDNVQSIKEYLPAYPAISLEQPGNASAKQR